ncbi:MAG: hypothetical protein EHM24_15455 [Acidobacteria bacterium]|nr:MAG: hypothetical protein EHM24_15455 [Acidobacteriota bacterium]
MESESSGSPPREEDQGLLDMVRGRALNELNARKDEMSRTLETVARTVRRAGEPLRDLPYEAPARYADGAASGLERFAAGLRQRDVSELPDDVRGLARRQPSAFLAAGFAVGVFAARFLKSSAVEEGPRTPAAPVGGTGRARTAGPGVSGGVRGRSPRAGTAGRESGHI